MSNATLTTAQGTQTAISSKRRKIVTRIFTQEAFTVQDFQSGFIFKCDTTSTGVNVTFPTAAVSNKGNYYHFVIENGPGTGTLTFTFTGSDGQGYYHSLDQWLDSNDDTSKVTTGSASVVLTGATKGTHLCVISDGDNWNISGFAALPLARPTSNMLQGGDSALALDNPDHRGITLVHTLTNSVSEITTDAVDNEGFKHFVYVMDITTTANDDYQLSDDAEAYFVHNGKEIAAATDLNVVSGGTTVGPDFWEITYTESPAARALFTGMGGTLTANFP